MAVPILLKAALPSVPLVNRLPGIRKHPDGDPSVLSFDREVVVDRGHVSAYAAVCGFPEKDTVPLTYPHVLAFPLQMAIMTNPEFPFPAIGSSAAAKRFSSFRTPMSRPADNPPCPDP